MALWNEVISAPNYIKDRIFKQYGTDFPVEVRHFFADTIENIILVDDLTENDPGFEQHAIQFLEKLLLEMNGRIPEVDVMTQVRLTEAARKFQQQLYNAAPLYSYLRNCLNNESNLVRTNVDVLNTMINLDSEHISTKDKLRELAQKVQMNAELNRKIIGEYERYALNFHNFTKANIQLAQEMNTEEQKQAVLKRRNAEIEYCFNKILEMILQLESSFRETLEMFKNIFTTVLKFLNQWKERQSLSGNGARFMDTLGNIQEYFEILADIIWTTKEQIKVAMQSRESLKPVEPNLCEYLPLCLQDATSLLEVLIKNSFVIEKQPPQVMKTNTRFTATVRLLIGSKLNIHMTQNLVKVSIVSEMQAQATQNSNKATEAQSGEILNNSSNLEFSQPQKTLNANFRNMQLKKIKRAEKKGTESVMDEKFALLFQTNFTIGDFTFTVWALSLPVVVIVHGNQEPQSWATITWDNAFAQITRIPFQVPDKVPWPRLADALNTKFQSATEKELTEMNLLFLCEKAFKQQIADPTQMEISWSQFCKEPIPERSFTFWEWFFAIMKLTREHLRNLWKVNLIMGFVHKKQAEEMLMKCAPGTFLLRFSDSELGGVTIAWINDMGDGQKQIVMLQPFLAKDFGIRSLADRIHDLPQLTTLYPNLPKDTAFGEFYTPIPESQNNGYVKPVLVIQLPRNDDQSSNYAGSNYMQSPEHTRDTASVNSYIAPPIGSVDMDIQTYDFVTTPFDTYDQY